MNPKLTEHINKVVDTFRTQTGLEPTLLYAGRLEYNMIQEDITDSGRFVSHRLISPAPRIEYEGKDVIPVNLNSFIQVGIETK